MTLESFGDAIVRHLPQAEFANSKLGVLLQELPRWIFVQGKEGTPPFAAHKMDSK